MKQTPFSLQVLPSLLGAPEITKITKKNILRFSDRIFRQLRFGVEKFQDLED